MLNIIPRPVRAEQYNQVIPFSSKTELAGDFGSIFETVSQLLPASEDAPENTLRFVCDKQINKEGYRITCTGQDITIYACDEAGAFYGVMTILQLCGGKDSFCAVDIEDKPRYYHRGFMLDCARHF